MKLNCSALRRAFPEEEFKETTNLLSHVVHLMTLAAFASCEAIEEVKIKIKRAGTALGKGSRREELRLDAITDPTFTLSRAQYIYIKGKGKNFDSTPWYIWNLSTYVQHVVVRRYLSLFMT